MFSVKCEYVFQNIDSSELSTLSSMSQLNTEVSLSTVFVKVFDKLNKAHKCRVLCESFLVKYVKTYNLQKLLFIY